MLKEAHRAGHAAALEHFGLKVAEGPPVPMSQRFKNWGNTGLNMLIGSPKQTYQQGWDTFAPGGNLHYKNVLWPTVAGSKTQTYLGRAGTVMGALPVIQALRGRGDPNEGRLSNMLGAAGNFLGSSYGFPAGGIIGSSILGHAGASLGKHVGHFLGSRPAHWAHPLPSPPQQEPQPAFPPQFGGQ